MFICNNCDDGRVVNDIELQIYKPNQIESISVQSDSEIKGLNTIMIKKSNYNQYFAKNKDLILTDPQFPPSKQSLNKLAGRQIIWKRISQIVPKCILFKETIKANEVYYGNMGDKYFLPTIAALARYPNRIRKIFHLSPNIQTSCIYRLLVKKGGQIHQLIIDDYVPVYKDSGRPVFCKANGNQIWCMLLQKAWAKLKGSYGAILKGCPHEVLSTFCFAPCITYDLKLIKSQESKKILDQSLKQAYIDNFVICATSSNNINLLKLDKQTVFPITSVFSNGFAKLHNYLQPPSFNRQIGLEQSSSHKSLSLKSQKNQEQGDYAIKLQQLLSNFSRIDISHENSTFNSQFTTLIIHQKEPIFVQFQVKQDHQTYIVVERSKSLSFQGKPCYIRMILAKKKDQDTFQFEEAKHQTHFPDCFIQLPKFQRGKHILLIKTAFPEGGRKQSLTLTYSWKNTKKAIEKTMIKTEKLTQTVNKFLQSVFLDHSQANGSLIFDPKIEGEWIKRVDLFQKCGIGYIVCGVSLHSKYHFKININKNQIKENGLEILGQLETVERVLSGSQKVFVFQLIKDQFQVQFPPKGFSIVKVI